MNIFLETYQKIGPFSHRFFIKFHHFFGINFRIDFFIDFWWKMGLEMVRQKSGPEAFFSSFSRPCLLCSFYVEFGSPWAPFGVLSAHFWRPLAHFWPPLAHFWLPLAPFWLTFGVSWLTFGALSFTFAHPGIHFLTFAVSCHHFSYLFEFSMKISCKIWFLNHFLWKSYSRSIKSYFPEAHRTHPNRKYIFSCNPPFKGSERNICRRQLRLID